MTIDRAHHSHRRRRLRAGLATGLAVALAVALLALGVVACGGSEEGADPETRQEIEEMLAAYLPGLAEFYRTGDPAPVEGLAALKEIERTRRLIAGRAAEGRVVEPNFKRFEIESLTVYLSANAYVTTYEVWDLRIRAAGSDRVIAEELDKPDRFRYQLKRSDGAWKVLHREVVEGE